MGKYLAQGDVIMPQSKNKLKHEKKAKKLPSVCSFCSNIRQTCMVDMALR